MMEYLTLEYLTMEYATEVADSLGGWDRVAQIATQILVAGAVVWKVCVILGKGAYRTGAFVRRRLSPKVDPVLAAILQGLAATDGMTCKERDKSIKVGNVPLNLDNAELIWPDGLYAWVTVIKGSTPYRVGKIIALEQGSHMILPDLDGREEKLVVAALDKALSALHLKEVAIAEEQRQERRRSIVEARKHRTPYRGDPAKDNELVIGSGVTSSDFPKLSISYPVGSKLGNANCPLCRGTGFQFEQDPKLLKGHGRVLDCACVSA